MHWHGFITLPLVLLLVGISLAAGVTWIMALVLLRPPRMTDGRAAWRLRRLSPGDLQLRFSDLTFTIQDERNQPLRLAAWWMPHPNAKGRCAILLHGYGDAKVGAIAWAPTLHELGFNVLALDLRAHGASEGRHCTAGFFERHDVSQVIDQLKRDFPAGSKTILLFGISLGAAVAAAAAVLRDDIAAVVMECPYPDYELATASHANVLGAPGPWLASRAFKWAQRISGADFDAVRPVELIPKIPCPLMVIRSEADVFVDDAHAAMIEEATKQHAGETVYWNAENAHHVAAICEDPVEYKERLEAFLRQAGVLRIDA